MSHAMLSPSSAKRWINCPPSAKINAEAGDRETAYTREGTLAHAVAELKARKYFLTGIGPKKFKAQMEGFRENEAWQDEMDGHTDRYLEDLKDCAAAFRSRPHVAIEQRVSFEKYVPDGFGTADCIMIGDGAIHVIDFKYGKGVPVSAEWNPQMMLYGLGALEAYDLIYDIGTVRMTIIQPRLAAEPSTWEISVANLLNWARDVVQPAAQLAALGEGEFHEGDWCRFCALRGRCREQARTYTALEDFGEKPPAELSSAEIGNVLTIGERLATWLKQVQEYALSVCLSGEGIPGFKAVEGRSVRAWTDREAAFAAATESGVPEEMLYELKPITLAAVEKLMGKKAFSEWISPYYVTTPPGKPTLVPDSDTRPAITNRTTAAEDFFTD